MTPALPKLVSSQGGLRSITVTDNPRSASCKAQQTPTMPAPITITLLLSVRLPVPNIR
jgi:hypothetical protein